MAINNNNQTLYLPPAETKIIDLDRFQLEIIKPYNHLQYCLSQTEVDRVINKNGSSNLEYQLKSQNLWHSELPRSLTTIKPTSKNGRRKMVKIRPIPLEMAWQYWIIQANYGRREAQELVTFLGDGGYLKIKELADGAFGIKPEVAQAPLAPLPYPLYQQQTLQETINHLQQITKLLSKVTENLNSYSSFANN